MSTPTVNLTRLPCRQGTYVSPRSQNASKLDNHGQEYNADSKMCLTQLPVLLLTRYLLQKQALSKRYITPTLTQQKTSEQAFALPSTVRLFPSLQSS